MNIQDLEGEALDWVVRNLYTETPYDRKWRTLWDNGNYNYSDENLGARSCLEWIVRYRMTVKPHGRSQWRASVGKNFDSGPSRNITTAVARCYALMRRDGRDSSIDLPVELQYAPKEPKCS